MKRYSSKSKSEQIKKPIKNFAFLSGVFRWSLNPIKAVTIILIIGNCLACSAIFDFESKTDIIKKNTEAQSPIQGAASRMTNRINQGLDIIGLFAMAGSSNEFLSVSSSGKVSVWPLKGGKERILFPSGEPVSACAYNLKRNLLAVTQDTGVFLYDLNTNTRLARSPNLSTKSASVEFAPDGLSLLLGGEDGRVYRWRLKEVETDDPVKKIEIERYIGHSASVTALAFHPFNRMFLSADSFGAVAAWLTYDKDIFGGKYDERVTQTTYYSEDGPRALTTSADATTVLSLRISNDGQNVFVALQDGRVEWHLVRGLKLVVVAKANSGAIYDMQISPSGKLLATVARDGVVRIWRLISLEKPGEAPNGKESVSEINDFKRDSIGYLSLVKEFSLEAARKLLFLSDSTLVVGESSGRLLEIDLPQ